MSLVMEDGRLWKIITYGRWSLTEVINYGKWSLKGDGHLLEVVTYGTTGCQTIKVSKFSNIFMCLFTRFVK